MLIQMQTFFKIYHIVENLRIFTFLASPNLVNENWHLASLLARFCRYLSRCQKIQNIPNGLSPMAIFAN